MPNMSYVRTRITISLPLPGPDLCAGEQCTNRLPVLPGEPAEQTPAADLRADPGRKQGGIGAAQ